MAETPLHGTATETVAEMQRREIGEFLSAVKEFSQSEAGQQMRDSPLAEWYRSWADPFRRKPDLPTITRNVARGS
jgi:hypothetical protein